MNHTLNNELGKGTDQSLYERIRRFQRRLKLKEFRGITDNLTAILVNKNNLQVGQFADIVLPLGMTGDSSSLELFFQSKNRRHATGVQVSYLKDEGVIRVLDDKDQYVQGIDIIFTSEGGDEGAIKKHLATRQKSSPTSLVETPFVVDTVSRIHPKAQGINPELHLDKKIGLVHMRVPVAALQGTTFVAFINKGLPRLRQQGETRVLGR